MKLHSAAGNRFLLFWIAFMGSLTVASAGLVGNDYHGKLYNIDTTTGAATFIGDTRTGFNSLVGISLHPLTGVLYGLTNSLGTPPNSLIQINPATAFSVAVGNTGISLSEGDIAFDPVTGRLVGGTVIGPRNGNQFPLDLYEINPLSAASTIMGSVGVYTVDDFSALAFNKAGTLFALNTRVLGANTILNTINPFTGAILTSVTTNLALGSTVGMAFDPLTGIAYVANGNSLGGNLLYRLNTTTGQFTSIGPLGLSGGIAGLSFTPAPVPEPSTALFAVAIIGFCVLTRNRR